MNCAFSKVILPYCLHQLLTLFCAIFAPNCCLCYFIRFFDYFECFSQHSKHSNILSSAIWKADIPTFSSIWFSLDNFVFTLGLRLGLTLGLRLGLRLELSLGLRLGLRLGLKLKLSLGLRLGLRWRQRFECSMWTRMDSSAGRSFNRWGAKICFFVEKPNKQTDIGWGD